MAIAINATAGSPGANSYCTIAEATTYHKEQRYHTKDDWMAYSNDEKAAGLIWATRLLDEKIRWVGWKNSSAQALRWPRAGVYDRDGDSTVSNEVPQWLKNATAEFAYHLMGSDRTADSDTAGFKRMKIGDLELEPDKLDRSPTIPDSVMSIISFYGVKTNWKQRVLVRM